MLVLSRRSDQEILFPNAGIRIRILELKGNVARIGIEAPAHVQILRGELATTLDRQVNTKTESFTHALRNRLNKVSLRLHRLQQQWQMGQVQEANVHLEQAILGLDNLERELLALSQQEQVFDQANVRRVRALLVEDDANERELLAGILDMNGCDCQTAADGQEALDYLATHEPPDVVLLDMGLPRLHGSQILERLRQVPQCRGVKIIVLSGSTPSELGIPIGQGGVDAWFHKPISPPRLWDAIQKGLQGRLASN